MRLCIAVHRKSIKNSTLPNLIIGFSWYSISVFCYMMKCLHAVLTIQKNKIPIKNPPPSINLILDDDDYEYRWLYKSLCAKVFGLKFDTKIWLLRWLLYVLMVNSWSQSNYCDQPRPSWSTYRLTIHCCLLWLHSQME